MATVHLGRLIGNKGFSRTVAIKQLHAQLVHDAEFAAMFLDEAHLTARIRHPNVVAPLDIIECEGEICIVMEYVHGESLGRLMQLAADERIPERIVSAVMIQVLLGLHAAHVATDDHGQPLSIVHRDVSPQNILVGEDGIARVVDFGIAKAARRIHSTDGDKLKGKLGYMSPEQLRLGPIDQRSDLFAAGIILWELLTGKELFTSQEPVAAIEQMLRFQPQPPSCVVTPVAPGLDEVVLKALSVEPDQRYATAREMARAIEASCPPAGTLEVSEWVNRLAATALERRAEWIADIEEMSLDELTRTHPVSNTANAAGVGQAPFEGQPELNAERTSKHEPSESAAPDALPRVASQSPSLVVTTSKTPLGSERRTLLRSWRARTLGLVGVAVLASAGFLVWTRIPKRHAGVTVTALGPVATGAEGPPRLTASSEISPVAPAADSASNTLDVPDASALSAPHNVPNTRLEVPDASASSPPRDTRTLTLEVPDASTSGAPRDTPTTTKHTATATTRSATTTQPAKGPMPNCKTPYFVDAQGIKRFRLECFSRAQ